MSIITVRETAKKILEAPTGQLSFPNYVISLIREWGLHDDTVIDFGEKNEKYRTNLGMLQCPEQLAPALIYLKNFKIKSFMEVGSFTGSTHAFICLYLSRFGLTDSITVDLNMDFDPGIQDILRPVLSHRHVKGTSHSVKGVESDLCFIDADHSYEGVRLDYTNVGRYSKICMFHDIIDNYVLKERWDCGTKQFWNEIKLTKFHKEFTAHADKKEIMGIGVIQ